MEKQELQEKITQIESKREYLLQLLEKPNLGNVKNRCQPGDRRT
jgi:hypothetical protein